MKTSFGLLPLVLTLGFAVGREKYSHPSYIPARDNVEIVKP